MRSSLKVVYSSDAKRLSKQEEKNLSMQYSFEVKENGKLKNRRSKVCIIANSVEDYKIVEKRYEGIKVGSLPSEFYELVGWVKGVLGERNSFSEIIFQRTERDILLSVIGDSPEIHETVLRYGYIESTCEDYILCLVKRFISVMSEKYDCVNKVIVKSMVSSDILKCDTHTKELYVGYGGVDKKNWNRELIILLGNEN